MTAPEETPTTAPTNLRPKSETNRCGPVVPSGPNSAFFTSGVSTFSRATPTRRPPTPPITGGRALGFRGPPPPPDAAHGTDVRGHHEVTVFGEAP